MTLWCIIFLIWKLFVKTTDNLFEFAPRNSVYEKSEFKPNNVNDLGADLIEFDDQIISTNNYDITSTKNGKTENVWNLNF